MSIKKAQKTPWHHKLREAISPSQFLESFNKEFAEYMDKLRDVDEKIRKDSEVLKAYLDESRSNFNKREYVLSFMPLSKFYETNKIIVDDISSLMNELKSSHFQVLLQDIDDESFEYLKGLSDKLQEKKSSAELSLKKTAGIIDWFKNLVDKRSWALRALEKRFPTNELESFKKNMESLIEKAEKLFKSLKLNFRKMSLARATRNIRDYFKAASIYTKEFEVFKKDFSKFYSTQMSKVIAEMELIRAKESEYLRKIEEEKSRKLEQKAPKDKPATGEYEKQIPGKYPKLQEEEKESKVKQDLKEEKEKALQELEKMHGQANKLFISNLISKAKLNNPNILIKEILKYSELIEDIDKDLSLKLLSIAEGSVDLIKTAAPIEPTKKTETIRTKKPEKSELIKEKKPEKIKEEVVPLNYALLN